MASKHTKIPRAIAEFKRFLDYNHSAYYEASKHINSHGGWRIPYYSRDIFRLVANLEGNLYESLYPKLTEENPASDEEIMQSFRALLKQFTEDSQVFERIIARKKEKGDEVYLTDAEGITHELVYKAIYKLQEVIQLAEEDLINSRKEVKEGQTQLKEPTNSDQYLIGIVTATTAEFQAVKNKLTGSSRLPTFPDDSQIYYDGVFAGNNKRINVILTQCHHQGTAAASTTTTKLVLRYKPNLVVMLGHAAGNKKLLKTLNLGDLLICSEAVDYDQVTVIQSKGAKQKIKEKDRKVSVPADSTLISLLDQFASSGAMLSAIKQRFTGCNLFAHTLSYKVGKIISGDALVRSEKWFEKIIQDNTGAIGLDMETYGVYYSSLHTLFKNKPLFISIKSVSDFGSNNSRYPQGLESPEVRVPYAIHTSVEFFFEFAIHNLPI